MNTQGYKTSSLPAQDAQVDTSSNVPATQDTTSFAVTFANEITLTRRAFTLGKNASLRASVYGATLAYFMFAQHAKPEQVCFAVLGRLKPDPKAHDKAEGRMWRASKALAQYWVKNGVFAPMIGTNSFDAAATSALEFLKGKGVQSAEGLAHFLADIDPSTVQKPALALDVAVTNKIKKAIKDCEFGAGVPAALGAAIVACIGLANGKAFADAVDLALADLAQKAVVNAGTASDADPMHVPEPLTDADLIEKAA
jgi:hypothetical protein